MTCDFSPGPPVSSTNRTDRHDIIEILLKVALITIKQTNKQTNRWLYFIHKINPLRFKFICEFSSKHLDQLYISHNVHEFSVYIYNLDICTFYIKINIQMIKMLKSVEFIEQKWTMLAGLTDYLTYLKCDRAMKNNNNRCLLFLIWKLGFSVKFSFYTYVFSFDLIADGMVSVLASSAVDRESCHGRVKPKTKIGICCFSAKYVALRSKIKDWLARNRDNVAKFQFHWASTMKIELRMLV